MFSVQDPEESVDGPAEFSEEELESLAVNLGKSINISFTVFYGFPILWYLYINFACLSVCLNVKTAEGLSGPNLCGTLQERFMDAVDKKNFLCYCFTLYKEKMLTDRATIKH